VARLDPVKDLKTLIEAVNRVRLTRSNVTLAIIGEGPERQGLEAAAAPHDGAAVRFLGHRDDARDWLAAADIFVNSSVSEGISLTILEGMAASLPVVATRVGGTPEVVDETCGILVPARDAAALAVAIEQLASDPGRREQLGRAGRSRVARHFTMDRMVGDYARVYEEVG
jgi:glycosyltransferase involved in cell wall biosynthesis